MEIVKDKIYQYIQNKELKIEIIMDTYNHYIYTIINGYHQKFSQEDKEEILLDVYLTLWNNREKLDINKSMKAYLAGITKNLMKKKARNQKQTENIDDYQEQLTEQQNIETIYLESQNNYSLLRELDKLKQEDREIFILYYYERKRIKEIAIKYKMTESKIKSKLFRMRRKLKKKLEEGGMIHGK